MNKNIKPIKLAVRIKTKLETKKWNIKICTVFVPFFPDYTFTILINFRWRKYEFLKIEYPLRQEVEANNKYNIDTFNLVVEKVVIQHTRS